MRKNSLLLIVLGLFSAFIVSAQVQVDHPIQLTGMGANAKVTGIADVSGTSDAVNVNYVQNGQLIFAVDSSTTGNSYSVPFSPSLTGYTVGMVVNFKANLPNTGSATLSVNGLAADSIVKNYNVDLAANDIQSGQMVIVMFDGTNWQMLSQIGNTPVAPNNTGDPTLIYTTNGF